MQQRSGLRPVRGAHPAVQAAEGPPRFGRHQHHPTSPTSQPNPPAKGSGGRRASIVITPPSHQPMDGMSIRPIVVLLNPNADGSFSSGNQNEWGHGKTDNNFQSWAKKTHAKIHALFTCWGYVTQECPILSLLNSNVCSLCFACPAAGHFHPDVPEPKHRQPCTDYTWGKKKKGQLLLHGQRTPVLSLLPPFPSRLR